MEKQHTNSNLISDLKNSDFLYLDGDLKFLKPYAHSVSIIKGQRFIYLDPKQMAFSLEQFIKVLIFLKTCENGSIHFLVDNKYQLNIIKSFLRANPISIPCTVSDSFSKATVKRNGTQFLISLKPFEDSKAIWNRLFENNIFLVAKVNTKNETSNFGAYKIYNNLSTFNKLIFFLNLIKTSLSIKI